MGNEITTTRGAGLIPTTIEEGMKLATILANSGLVPNDFKGKPESVFVAINWGLEIGISPIQAVQNIAVINGRPAIWGDLALALVRGSGKLESIKETQTETEAICIVKRVGEEAVERRFTKVDAERAGLWDNRPRIKARGQNYEIANPSPWYRTPKRMLQMRARGFALRDVFPDVLKGIGIAEEVRDIPTDEIEATVEPTVTPETQNGEATTVNLSATEEKPVKTAPKEEEVTEAVIEEEVVTTATINAFYKKADKETKSKILEKLPKDWKQKSSDDLAEIYETIKAL